MNKPLHAQLAILGDYKLRILNADRTVKYESPDWIPNLVTNQGLDNFGSGTSFANTCRIGTGTATPAITDTQLQTQAAATSTVVGGSDSVVNAGAPNYETICTRTFEFAQGAVVGNMAEIGVGSASTGATLSTRSRILDGGGAPTTITVQATEILQVTYRLAMFPQLTDSTGNITISGTTYAYTSRIYNAATAVASLYAGSMISGTANNHQCLGFNGALGSITASNPGGSSSSITIASVAAYTAGTYYRDITISASLAQGNLAGGLSAISLLVRNQGLADTFRSQIGFSPALPKDNTKLLSLTFRISWTRR